MVYYQAFIETGNSIIIFYNFMLRSCFKKKTAVNLEKKDDD